jgi:hypothetical protein
MHKKGISQRHVFDPEINFCEELHFSRTPAGSHVKRVPLKKTELQSGLGFW